MPDRKTASTGRAAGTGRAARSRGAKAAGRPVAPPEAIGRLIVCPNCGAHRTGSFRFCRSCGLDFDLAESGSAMRIFAVPARSEPMSPGPVEEPGQRSDTDRSDGSVRAARSFPHERQGGTGPLIAPRDGPSARTIMALAAAVAVLAGLVSWLIAIRVP